LKKFGHHLKNCDGWMATIFLKIAHPYGQPKQAEGGLSYSFFFNLHPKVVIESNGGQNAFGCHLMVTIESILFAI
jgi:hypothetical protein